ncbi:MAG: hydantoinase/oxoprolinase family protein [Solirubrobacteraceae bacterium]
MTNGSTSARRPRVLAIDAGGTMTDTFVVDEHGSFVVGKAQTTPDDEARGFMESSADAFRQWGMTVEEGFPSVRSGVFSGTAMLNRLLSRKGLDVGVIVTAGQEDSLLMERGIQAHLGYSYGDRLHVATHYHNPPLVPRERVFGVRGRVDLFGNEVLPLREQDARDAANALLDAGVKGISICLLYCYRNPGHEQRVKAIVEEEKAKRGRGGNCPVFVSSELYPSRREFPRLNTTVIEAYAAEPSRGTLKAVRDRTKERGAGFELRVMASHGGTISIDSDQLATTLVSGPIGGVMGARWLAEEIGLRNVLATDIGGTSFDIALLTDRRYEVDPTPNTAQFMLSMPLVRIDSVGAGCGSFVRIDPNSRRPEIGPDSAGATIGVAWPQGGVETVSITDLNLVLGRLNPDNFLGGQVKLDTELARHEIERQIATPLGLGVETAAAGIIELFEAQLRNEAVSRILGKGYSPSDYTLLCYGGGGPLHVAGYTAGIPYEEVLVPEWAAGFSAFGCACADFEYRFDQQLDLPLLPHMSDPERAGMGQLITGVWRALEARTEQEFSKAGYDKADVTFNLGVRMQYYGQLIDIEVDSPHAALDTAERVADLIGAFEETYARLYARAASSPELGYLVSQAIVKGKVKIEKPSLPTSTRTTGTPAVTATRPVWWDNASGFVDTPIIDMVDVSPGHEIQGPAILEAESTTFAVPPDRSCRLDEHRIFHLRNDKER